MKPSLAKVSLLIFLISLALPALRLGGDTLFGWQAFVFAPAVLLPSIAWTEPWVVLAGILGTTANVLFLASYVSDRLCQNRVGIWAPFACSLGAFGALFPNGGFVPYEGCVFWSVATLVRGLGLQLTRRPGNRSAYASPRSRR